MAGASIDLTKRAWTHRRGPITAIGTWINLGDQHRPCMALIRTGEEYAEATVPCVITMDKAWVWSEDIGDPAQAARTAHTFCQYLRLDDGDPRQVVRIGMLVNDLLGDLLSIPPYRHEPEAKDVIAEVTITDTDGRTREVELTDDA